MQGGMAVNVSGPCLRDGDNVKVAFESWVVDCKRLNVSCCWNSLELGAMRLDASPML